MDRFEQREWAQLCEKLAKETNAGAGCSHTVYVNRFSQAVDIEMSKLSDTDKIMAIVIAKDFDYHTAEEIEAESNWLAENGYCSHGLDKNCCPVGCGDLEA